MSLRDLILKPRPLPMEKVDVPEWGDEVFVRVMSGAERERFEALHEALKLKDFRARVAVFTVCDRDGVRAFTEDDTAALSALSTVELDRIARAALRLNKITEADAEALAKN